MLTVQDNGLGLELGKQAELFTMFRRFHAHVEGSGIGLYMVKRIVDNVGAGWKCGIRRAKAPRFRCTSAAESRIGRVE